MLVTMLIESGACLAPGVAVVMRMWAEAQSPWPQATGRITRSRTQGGQSFLPDSENGFVIEGAAFTQR